MEATKYWSTFHQEARDFQMIGSLFARPLREGRAKPCGCNGGLLVVMEAEILARSGKETSWWTGWLHALIN
jgi:hypothetical protein